MHAWRWVSRADGTPVDPDAISSAVEGLVVLEYTANFYF
jgi:hypothetical protein